MEPFPIEDDQQSTHPNYAAMRSRLATALPSASPYVHTAGVPGMSYPMMNSPYLDVQHPQQPESFNTTTGVAMTLPPPSNTYSVYHPSSSTNPTMYGSMHSSANPSSIANSPYENYQLLYQPSTSPSVVASKKRKWEDQGNTPTRTPPAPLGRSSRLGVSSAALGPTQVPSAPPLGLFGSIYNQRKPISQILQDYGNTESLEHARRATTAVEANASIEDSLSRLGPGYSRRVQPQTSARSRISSLASSAAIEEDNAKATNHAKPSNRKGNTKAITVPPLGASPSYDADNPELHQLDFDPDLQYFGMDALYFMTVADRKKARSRGFKEARDVYGERLRQPNIETADINLAWIPGPGTHDGRFPWQPICGPAAYIAAIRGDLKLEYTLSETLYMQGNEYKAGEAIDIPMLHSIVISLWAKNDYGKTDYDRHRRTKSSVREDYMTFLPSQSGWSPSNIPPSAAVVEPLKVGKSDVPIFKDRDGNDVLDADGQPHRAFDHILPAHIPSSVEGWLLAAWVAEDPRLLWKDIEANMVLQDKEAGRLGDRYAKYRDGLAAMTRSVKSHRTSKTDLKTITKQRHENLVGNSWWFVDLDKELMCQSKDPMAALEEGLPAYPLPPRRKEGYQYSDRMVAVQDALKAENHSGKEVKEEERSA